MQAVGVILERMTANDDFVTVVSVLADGTKVKCGDRIIEVETSKAIYDVEAPADGILKHSLKIGDTILAGSQIAHIVEEGVRKEMAAGGAVNPKGRAETIEPNHGKVASRTAGASKSVARFSREARALAMQYGLKAEDFDGGLITTADVRQRYYTQRGSPRMEPGALLEQSGGKEHNRSTEPMPPWKQDQITALQSGAGASMLSVVGCFLGGGPYFRAHAGFFETKITDLVVLEASRLMLQFSRLNARYRRGTIEYHNRINAGVAFGGYGSLVVHGIPQTDQLSLHQIQNEIVSGFRKYVQKKLTDKDVVRATFTITDLSAAGAEFVFPLLPEGQSCIIAITHSPERAYGLYIGFDHRVTDGFEVSRFLSQLKKRLLEHLISNINASRT